MLLYKEQNSVQANYAGEIYSTCIFKIARNRSNIMDTMKSFEQQLIDNKTEFAALKEELAKERKCSPKVCLLAEKLAKFRITIEEDDKIFGAIK